MTSTSGDRMALFVAACLVGALVSFDASGTAHASVGYPHGDASPATTRTPGITQMRQGPFATAIFRVTGMWQGQVGRRWLVVYAGGIPARHSEPGLPVQVARAGLRLYSEPVQAGGADDRMIFLGTVLHYGGTSLTLLSEDEGYLHLVDDAGSAVTFDMQHQGFVTAAAGSTTLRFECPEYVYDQAVPIALLHAMQRWSKRHGFTVRSAQMSAALPLPIFTTSRKCLTAPDGIQRKPVKVPRTATEVRSVLARIRYPGSNGEQPSPGRPYFLVARFAGAWSVVTATGMDEAWMHY